MIIVCQTGPKTVSHCLTLRPPYITHELIECLYHTLKYCFLIQHTQPSTVGPVTVLGADFDEANTVGSKRESREHESEVDVLTDDEKILIGLTVVYDETSCQALFL